MPDRRQLLACLAGAALAPGIAPAADDPLDDAEVERLLGALFLRDGAAALAALSILETRRRDDVVSTLILALRFSPHPREPILKALAGLTGETGRAGWFDWMLWQEAHPEVESHPAFYRLKRALLLSLDPRWEAFLRPEFIGPGAMEIRFEEIAWGGVKRDGIPSLDAPRLIAAAEAGYLRDDDPVFGAALNGDARAYPLRIMGWHEMFNDVIGGVPVALAYCTLCGAGILFATAVEGRAAPLIMGTSGFLYRSNKLMYDRETESLWNQFTGRPVSGALRGSGIALETLPVTIEPWGAWRARNPETRVLALETGFDRDYGSGVVYRDYFASPDLMFPALADETAHLKKDQVFGVRAFAAAKAWPLEVFAGGRVLNDAVGGTPIVLIGDAAGRTVRAYERGGRNFAKDADPAVLLSEGARWRVTEAALAGPGGETLPRVAGHVAYWFAWSGYMGEVAELYAE